MGSRPVSLGIELIGAALGESKGRAKYKQDMSNVQRYWMATHSMRNLLYIVHTTCDPKWPVHQAIHWIWGGLPYK